jgi:CRISPR-associated protein (TIGR03986 family)
MPPPNSIDAPYNFVPLADWVHTPEWADKVSHDIPFADGLSGYLDIRITAHTPIVVGAAHDETPGVVRPYALPDGRYALPGTSVKGMIRSVIEIASFSRMYMVDDQRLGVRDLTTGARPFYGNLMTQTVANRTYRARPKSGWLSFDTAKDKWVIAPCRFSRVEQSHLDAFHGDTWIQDNKDNRMTARQKYDNWGPATTLAIRFDPQPETDHPHSCGYLRYSKAANLGAGATNGTLVFTGQPSAKKHLEFIFYGSAGPQLEVPEDVFRGFLDIHDQKTERSQRSVWDEWRAESRIPVFYLEQSGRIESLGLALMYKLAYRNSIHEAIRHSSAAHLNPQVLDLATLLFGQVGDSPEACLKGRVTFRHAVAIGSPQSTEQPATILNGPKPTYYPNYIRQPRATNNRVPEHPGYATLMEPECQLRGWKRYPARSLAQSHVQPLTPEQQVNTDVQVRLHTLPENTAFETRVVFHNLKPEELGALCWALTWAGLGDLRHQLGMGKPFGFGQVGIAIQAADIRPNCQDSPLVTWEEARDRFVLHMEKAARRRNKPWSNSPQIAALLGMADPAKSPSIGSLRHMRLTTENDNQFRDAKMVRLVLADYPGRPHPPLPEEPPPPPPPEIRWTGCEIQLNPGSGELKTQHQGQTAFVTNQDAQKLRDALPADLKDRLKSRRLLKDCTVSVEQTGKVWRIIAILAVGETKLEPPKV